MRILVYTGKGGVGKTSIAASSAVRCAALGYRTVVLSTDLAHSLADSLDVPLGPEPSLVAPNLWAQETDIYNNLQTHWGIVQEWLNAILRWSGEVDTVVADELTVLPGMDELANLLWINRHRESGRFDVIVVDAAPTGETLRLLSFPEVMRWWMQRIFPIQRRAMGVARPLIGAFVDMPLPSDKVYESVERLFVQLDALHGMLINPQLTSVRLVLNPEKMVVSEAQRTSTYFHLFGYPLDLVVANRVLPDTVRDPYFTHWKETQTRYLQRVEEGFSPVPIKQVPLFDDEVVGLDALVRMAQALYGEEDPAQIYYTGQAQVLKGTGPGSFRLTIPLPFATHGEVSLRQTGDELFVHVGAHRRHIILPRALIGLRATRAKLDEEHATLTVDFESG
ncbi:MAG TPA: ArsA family ATPase [Chloroflexota bacterium]|jgi:arsenite-transporting ATPase